MRPKILKFYPKSQSMGTRYRNFLKVGSNSRLPLFFRPSLIKARVGKPCTYLMGSFHKGYLVSKVANSTWGYTQPDLSLGAFLRLFCGVFMRHGNFRALATLVKGSHTWLSSRGPTYLGGLNNQWRPSCPELTLAVRGCLPGPS